MKQNATLKKNLCAAQEENFLLKAYYILKISIYLQQQVQTSKMAKPRGTHSKNVFFPLHTLNLRQCKFSELLIQRTFHIKEFMTISNALLNHISLM